jgi:hypothetical protein
MRSRLEPIKKIVRSIWNFCLSVWPPSCLCPPFLPHVERDRSTGSCQNKRCLGRLRKDNRMTHNDFNHLLSSIKALSPEQARQLRQQLDGRCAKPKKPTAPTPGTANNRIKRAVPKKKMTEAEFDQHLLKIGLISSLPDPALDIDDDDPDDQPVTIKGEPLSATIIRERR